MQNCVKKPGAHLPGVVNHKLWHCQLCEPVPHTPVHSGRSPWVVVVALVVAQEVEVEERDRVVKMVHEQHVAMVVDLRVSTRP